MKKNINSIERLSNLKCFGHAGKRITFICIIYSVICGTLYCVSTPTVFKFVFGVESSNLITNCLKLISLIGIILSVLCIICDYSFGLRILSSIIAILGHITFLVKGLTFTLIPFILIIIALKLYISDNNKKQIRIIK